MKLATANANGEYDVDQQQPTLPQLNLVDFLKDLFLFFRSIIGTSVAGALTAPHHPPAHNNSNNNSYLDPVIPCSSKTGLVGRLQNWNLSGCLTWFWDGGSNGINALDFGFNGTRVEYVSMYDLYNINDTIRQAESAILTTGVSPYIQTWIPINTDIDASNVTLQTRWKSFHTSLYNHNTSDTNVQRRVGFGPISFRQEDTFNHLLSTFSSTASTLSPLVYATVFFASICPTCTAPQFNRTCCEYLPDFITASIEYTSLVYASGMVDEVTRLFDGVEVWISQVAWVDVPR